MKIHPRPVEFTVRARRELNQPVVAVISGLHVAMNTAEARALADALHDTAEKAEESMRNSTPRVRIQKIYCGEVLAFDGPDEVKVRRRRSHTWNCEIHGNTTTCEHIERVRQTLKEAQK